MPALILRPGWSQTKPIKLGMVEVRSGPSKYIGDSRIDATTAVVERINAAGGVLGRKVEVVAVDGEYKPDVSLRRSKELLQGEKVDVITAFGSAIAKVTAQAAFDEKKLFISTAVMASETTGAEFLPTTFSLAPNNDMLARAAAAYVAGSDLKKIYILTYDTAGGRSAGESFRRAFQALKRPDQTLVGEEYHPFLRLTDFGPYITKVAASGADGIYTANFGPDSRLLIQQGKELGWKVRLVGNYLNDPAAIATLKEAAIGNIAIGMHQITIDTPENRAWIKIWKERFPNASLFSRTPDSANGLTVSGTEWLFDVIKRAGSLDTETLIKTWEGSKFRCLWGEAEMRACDHQMLSQCGIARIAPPAEIPEEFRVFGNDMPYLAPVGIVPKENATVPLAETGNPRCRA